MGVGSGLAPARWRGPEGQMQSEARLQPELGSAEEHAERLASLLTLSYEPMFAWRLDGQIEFWNAGAERLYGFPSNEAVGRASKLKPRLAKANNDCVGWHLSSSTVTTQL
jgi:two-component system, cell cycle sensor histidine kinase and response regulator CckA